MLNHRPGVSELFNAEEYQQQQPKQCGPDLKYWQACATSLAQKARDRHGVKLEEIDHIEFPVGVQQIGISKGIVVLKDGSRINV